MFAVETRNCACYVCSLTNLEELRLSRYFEGNNLRESIVVQPVIQKKINHLKNNSDDFLQPVEAANLAGRNVAASFRHAPHSSLRVWGLDKKERVKNQFQAIMITWKVLM